MLGNAQANGCPIVYCSDGFCELTGYARAHVMGKSCACKFLRGPKTNETEKEKIDEALENREEIKTEILLYRKGGNNVCDARMICCNVTEKVFVFQPVIVNLLYREDT